MSCPAPAMVLQPDTAPNGISNPNIITIDRNFLAMIDLLVDICGQTRPAGMYDPPTRSKGLCGGARAIRTSMISPPWRRAKYRHGDLRRKDEDPWMERCHLRSRAGRPLRMPRLSRFSRHSVSKEERREQRQQGNRLQEYAVSHPVLAVEGAILAPVYHRNNSKEERANRSDRGHNDQRGEDNVHNRLLNTCRIFAFNAETRP